MQYRDFGRLDWKVSALGYGAMRLPLNDDKTVNEEESIRLIRYAIDHGVNYVDTAYPYHDGGGEKVVGRALRDGYRDRVHLTTKSPVWLVQDAGDFDRYLDEQLEKLQTDHLDLYLFHALDRNRWDKILKLGALDWAEKRMADGKFRHLGFSFHDDYNTFEKIVDGYDGWDVCQIYYNFLGEENQAGRSGLKLAASRGLGVVVMGPLQGGMMAEAPPDPIGKLWDQWPLRRSPAEWGLRWVWNHPEVSVVLSGMNTLHQVVENLAVANDAFPDHLTAEALTLIQRVREQYDALRPVGCTACNYCQPCPSGVRIPDIFRIYNHTMMFGNLWMAQRTYGNMDPAARADQCIACGQCESLCPQHLEIIDWLKKSHSLLTSTPA